MPFDKESIKTKYVKNGPNLITKPESPAPEEILAHKLRSDISDLSGETGETSSGLTGVTRASVAPEKRIPNKKKYIKSLAMSSPRKDPIPNHY